MDAKSMKPASDPNKLKAYIPVEISIKNKQQCRQKNAPF